MPQCVYCMEVKALRKFDPEHVFSRGLCGTGQNWTLTEEVCKKCNGRFSAFEAHWMRQALESMVRNFEGPVSRNDKERFDRLQPVELEHLYIVNRDDPNVYEAGFSFPAEYHLRPQIVETPDGLVSLVGATEDIDRMQRALTTFLLNPIRVVVPTSDRDDKRNYVVAEIESRGDARPYTITNLAREQKPTGTWLRNFPLGGLLVPSDFIGVHSLSTRLCLDHRGRLYFRAANLELIPPFITRMGRNDWAPPLRKADRESDDQTVIFGFRLDLPKIYLAVLKNGFNLFTHFYGAEMARHQTFNLFRSIMMDDAKGKELARKYCRLENDLGDDFPKSGNPTEHRMQLDVNDEGVLRFRLRLFDSVGYYSHVAMLPAEWRSSFKTKRVVVDSSGAGISEVDSWK